MKTCPQCNEVLGNNVNKCPYCSHEFHQEQSEQIASRSENVERDIPRWKTILSWSIALLVGLIVLWALINWLFYLGYEQYNWRIYAAIIASGWIFRETGRYLKKKL